MQKGWIKPDKYQEIYKQYQGMLERSGFKYEQ